MNSLVPADNGNTPYIDSDWLTINTMIVSSMESTIRTHGNLSGTEYRTLLKIYETGSEVVYAEDLAYMLSLKMDAIIHVMEMLEKQSLVTSIDMSDQSSIKGVHITTIGLFRITSIDAALNQKTLSLFRDHLSPSDFETLGRCMAKVGAAFEHDYLSGPRRTLSLTSNTTACMMTLGESLHATICEAVDMTFTEARIMYRIHEQGKPSSCQAIATALFLDENKTYRALQKLVLARQLKEIPAEKPDTASAAQPDAMPTYYLENENNPSLRVISSALEFFAQQNLIPYLDDEENDLVHHIGNLVLGDIRRKAASPARSAS